MEKVLVSIRCLVYNHEPYLRQCLDGFVMQKTNFAFEAIVHDDASTDESAAIIREYAEKYPDIIKPIYETENQYSKKDGSLGKIMNAAIHPDAKYIAYCEGDDYWIDPYKLQKQFDFMESHKDYVLCVHNKRFLYQKTGVMKNEFHSVLNKNPNGFSFDLNYYCTGIWITSLLTSFIRKDAFLSVDSSKYVNFIDVILFFLILKHGRGFLMPDVMSVYRVHSGGVCSGTATNKFFLFVLESYISLYNQEKSSYALLALRNHLRRKFFLLIYKKDFSYIRETIRMCLPLKKTIIWIDLLMGVPKAFTVWLVDSKSKLYKYLFK